MRHCPSKIVLFYHRPQSVTSSIFARITVVQRCSWQESYTSGTGIQLVYNRKRAAIGPFGNGKYAFNQTAKLHCHLLHYPAQHQQTDQYKLNVD